MTATAAPTMPAFTPEVADPPTPLAKKWAEVVNGAREHMLRGTGDNYPVNDNTQDLGINLVTFRERLDELLRTEPDTTRAEAMVAGIWRLQAAYDIAERRENEQKQREQAIEQERQELEAAGAAEVARLRRIAFYGFKR